jgi:hypothetical protein
MLNWLLLFYSSILSVSSNGGGAKPYNFLVTVNSTVVTIAGTTNVNRFVCDLERESVNHSLQVMSVYENDTLRFEGLRLAFPINEFDCGIAMMNHDFQEFLREDVYPEMSIEIDHMVIKREGSLMEKVSVVSKIEIQLCGRQQTYTLPKGYVMELPENKVKLVSEDYVRFTDFGLIPPTKFFGTVKVHDELEVGFEIAMEVEAVD